MNRLNLVSVLAVATFLFGAYFHVAEAATLYVNSSTGNDSTGNGSSGSPYKTFHKAYTMASSSDTIDLSGTFDWSNTDETGDSTTTGYTISKSLTIRGQGAGDTFIQASSSAYTANRGVFVVSGSGINVTMKDLTIRYGYNTTDSGAAAVYTSSSANLVLDTVIVTQNASNGRFGVSGLRISGSGTFTLRNSAIHNNDGNAARTQNGASWDGYTGGLQVEGTGAITITNTTFYKNTAQYNGGILQSHGSSVVTLTNSTLMYNRGITTGHNYSLWSGTLYIKNTILADRYNASVADFVINSGTVNDGGGNIIESQSGSTFTNGVRGNLVGNQTSLNISTSSIALNGAANDIPTLALGDGSVAINAGTTTSHNSVSVPTTDARGLDRVDSPDIGAFEYGAENPDNTAPTVSVSAPNGDATVSGSSVTVSAAASDDTGVVGVRFYFGRTLIDSEDTSSPFSVVWDSTATTSGSKTLIAVARDAAGNVATSSPVIVTVSNTPTAETPNINTSNNSATFSWQTNLTGSTRLFFGLLSSTATSTAESNTGGNATTTHSVSLAGLPRCATYKYILVNRSLGGNDTATSSEQSFHTACTGNASVLATGQGSIATSSGGTLSHDTLSISVPTDFTSTTSAAVFQANTIDADTFMTAVGAPSDKNRFGNIYSLTAIYGETESLTSFEEPITITLSYAGLTGVDPDTLFIGRYDGTSWHVLSSTVDTGAKTVTATTLGFSDFSLFGDEESQAERTPGSVSGMSMQGRIMKAISNGNLSLAIELLLELIRIKGGEVAVISGDTSNQTPSVSTVSSGKFTRDLWLSDEGEDVKVLQQFLIDNGYSIRSGVTGYFGEITREALEQFQRSKGILPASGYFGPKTKSLISN